MSEHFNPHFVAYALTQGKSVDELIADEDHRPGYYLLWITGRRHEWNLMNRWPEWRPHNEIAAAFFDVWLHAQSIRAARIRANT